VTVGYAVIGFDGEYVWTDGDEYWEGVWVCFGCGGGGGVGEEEVLVGGGGYVDAVGECEAIGGEVGDLDYFEGHDGIGV